MQGAVPVASQDCPFSTIAPTQQSAEVNPGLLPHEEPPHTPHAGSQQAMLSPSSTPARPLLQVGVSAVIVSGATVAEVSEVIVSGAIVAEVNMSEVIVSGAVVADLSDVIVSGAIVVSDVIVSGAFVAEASVGTVSGAVVAEVSEVIVPGATVDEVSEFIVSVTITEGTPKVHTCGGGGEEDRGGRQCMHSCRGG